MLLTVLGCSGSVPGPGAAASGYLLTAEGFALGIELGTGTLAQLQLHGDPFALDALLFSHLHPDHCADVSALTVLRRYHPARPGGRLPVHAPGEAPSRFVAAYSPDAEDRAATDLSDTYDFRPWPPGPSTSDRSRSPPAGPRTRVRRSRSASRMTARRWSTPATPAGARR